MQINDNIKKLFRFQIAEEVLIKQEVINNTSRMSVNGKSIDEIFLQDCYVVLQQVLTVVDEDSYTLTYIVRPTAMHRLGRDINPNQLMSIMEHELCSKKEAVVILRLKNANSKN